MEARTGKVLLKSAAVWLAIVPCAILNGALREGVLCPILGETVARTVSGLLLMGIILLLSVLFIPRLHTQGDPVPVWRIGLLWVALTVAFETGLGTAQGADLSALLRNYDMSHGNLWPLVILFTGCAPRLALWLRH